MVRELEDGTVHFPPDDAGGALDLLPSSEAVRAPGDVEWLRVGDEAAAAGMTVRAWTIFFHNSRLGRAHRESTVCNAFGDRFSWGLCPARPEVQDYGERLARAVAAHPGLGVLEVEALGWMGNKHGSHHAKTAFAEEPFSDFLLSYCFCDVCQDGLREQTIDPEGLRADVRQILTRTFTQGDAMDPVAFDVATATQRLSDALGAPRLLGMLDHRRAVLRRNLERVRGVLPQGVRLASHLEWNPLFTGSQLGIEPAAVADLLDEVVLTCYGKDADAIASLWAGRPDLGDLDESACSVAFFPKAPQFRSEDDVARLRDGVAGVGGLRVYHLGLLPPRTLERVASGLSRG